MHRDLGGRRSSPRSRPPKSIRQLDRPAFAPPASGCASMIVPTRMSRRSKSSMVTCSVMPVIMPDTGQLPSGDAAWERLHPCATFHLPGRSPVYATHAMAATSMPAATLTALDVMRAGRQRAGRRRGGGGRTWRDRAAIHWDWRGQFLPVEAAGQADGGHERLRPCAAAAATIDWYRVAGYYLDRRERAPLRHHPRRSRLVGEMLLAAHGTKGLDELLQPAIHFAAEGWPVHHRVASDWQPCMAAKLRKNGAEAFLPNGSAPKAGDVFKPNRRWPRRCGRSPSTAARGFYEGAIAADMVATLRARGGLQTEEDFAAGRTAAQNSSTRSTPPGAATTSGNAHPTAPASWC